MTTTMRTAWPYLLSGLFIAGAAFSSMYARIENAFVFQPTSSLDATPEDGDLNWKEVFFSAEDGVQLHGWFFPARSGKTVLIFCHGNAGNISHRLELCKLLVERNLGVFIFDYRGYGRSQGSPSEQGIYQDGVAAYDYLVRCEGFSPDRIVAFGRSLGAAVAIEIVRKRPVKSVIVEGAFTSSRDMARTLPLIGLLWRLFPAHYDNLNKIGLVNCSKLFIHAEEDEVVPISMGKKLFEAAQPPREFLSIPHAGHNNTYLVAPSLYFEGIAGFVMKPEAERSSKNTP